MNKEQQKEVLKGVYLEAIRTMVRAVEDRDYAIHNYTRYLKTVEATIQVFNPSFDIERDLRLVPKGLDETSLRYVTRLDIQSQREQLDFYRDRKNTL